MTPSFVLPVPWGEHTLSDEAATIELGPLRLRVRHRHDEIWIATREEGQGARPTRATETAGVARSGEWVRWPLSGGSRTITLRPALPDRTVVAVPEAPLRLVPGAAARVFVRVPLWARIEAADGTLLLEVPTVRMSDTWQGNFTTGEICYWLGTTARRHVTDSVFASHLAVCPLELTNRSGAEAPVERLAVHVRHLRLYADGGRFWSNDTRIRYRGTEEESHLEAAPGPPAEAPGARQVAPPRDVSPPGVSRILGFVRLRALPGFGG